MLKILAVTNMYPTAFDPSQGTFVEQQVYGLRRVGADVRVLHLDRRSQGMAVYRRIPELLRQEIRDFGPDLVHCMYGGALAQVTTRMVSLKPVVVSFCGTDLFGEGGVGRPLRRMLSAYGAFASRAAARRASAVIVKSAGMLKALPSSVPYSKAVVIPNGIDMDRFCVLDRDACRGQLGWENERFHVLFTNGRRVPQKRVELAEAAVAILNRRGVPADLKCLPGVPHSEVPVWMNAADVVVLTSVHEGSPNAIKEALACNRPVVSVDVGDVRERIEGIAGCHLVAPDAESIAEGLRQVYNGPRSVAGRERMNELSLENASRRLLGVYQTVIGCSPDSPAAASAMPTVAGAGL